MKNCKIKKSFDRILQVRIIDIYSHVKIYEKFPLSQTSNIYPPRAIYFVHEQNAGQTPRSHDRLYNN